MTIADNPGMNDEGFGFERLDVYQRSIEFLAIASEIVEAMPRGHSGLADQLRRAALSIPLNIAEGTGRATDRDSAHHRTIPRGPATECDAILDAGRGCLGMDEERFRQARTLPTRIVRSP